MCRRIATLACALAILAGAPLVAPASAQPARDIRVDLDTRYGRTVIRLRPDLAPRHVERFLTLVRRGFYDGIAFHRVIASFMAQTGDPTGTGRGNSDLPDLRAEFTPTPYRRGTVGMARRPDPNSANSQWFICFTDDGCRKNDGRFTVFGEVVSGMDFIDRLKTGPLSANGQVPDPDRIIRIRVEGGTPAR